MKKIKVDNLEDFRKKAKVGQLILYFDKNVEKSYSTGILTQIKFDGAYFIPKVFSLKVSPSIQLEGTIYRWVFEFDNQAKRTILFGF